MSEFSAKRMIGICGACVAYYIGAGFATMQEEGRVTAVGKGKCTVYVYAVSGVSKKIKVTVK